MGTLFARLTNCLKDLASKARRHSAELPEALTGLVGLRDSEQKRGGFGFRFSVQAYRFVVATYLPSPGTLLLPSVVARILQGISLRKSRRP